MIQIINYGAGNLRSIQNALEKLGIESKIINSAKELDISGKTIFPGVGAAGSAMQQLKKTGFDKVIPKIKGPFLGICLGMQLLADFSEENNTEGLKILPGKVRKFPKTVKIPQIGWNKVEQRNPKSELFKDIPQNSYFYFVNSYYVEPNPNTIAETDYNTRFSSAIKMNNFYGVQFHPEKSGEIGLKLLGNFCKLC